MKKTRMHLKDMVGIKETKYDVDLLETLLYEWVRRSIYFKNFRVSNAILKSNAYRFKAILKLDSFSVTDEWLQNFRMIYNIKDVFTTELSDIGYKCSKSTTPLDIFNELQPKWESLDPKLLIKSDECIDLSETIDIEEDVKVVEIIDLNQEEKEKNMDVQDIPPNEDETNTDNTNSTELFDIEDELPVCTIFGRKTVANVANIISSSKKSNEDKFQPMIVCTDPKNPNLNTMDKTTKENKFLNPSTTLEVEKIKELINGKSIDTDANTSSQNEYIDQYLKEIVRFSEKDQTVNDTSSSQLSSKSTPETEKHESAIFKPISMSKQKLRKTNPGLIIKPRSDPSAEAINTECLDSNNLVSTKPNRKRKIEKNFAELPKNTNLRTEAEPTKQPIFNQITPPVESQPSLQTESNLNISQIPAVIQQAWDPTFGASLITSNFPKETTTDTQTSLISPGSIMYTFQMSAPNQNQLTMPYISPITTNLQATAFCQPAAIPPIVLHFHSPMTMQTTGMLPGSEMNLTQLPSISQTSFMPSSIDLTQQTPSTHFTNYMPNQFMPPISAQLHQSLSTNTPIIVTTPLTSTTSTQLGLNPYICSQSTTPTTHVPNCLTTQTRTTTSTTTSNLASKVPTPCISNKITSTTSTLIHPTVSTKATTITSTSNSSLTNCPTTTSTTYVSNCVSTQTTTKKRSQAPAATKTGPASNSRLTIPTAGIATKTIPTTSTLIHPFLSATTSTITPLTSNGSKTSTSPIYVQNCLPSKIELTKTKLTQATKTRTISTSTSNSGLTTPTAGILNFVPTSNCPQTAAPPICVTNSLTTKTEPPKSKIKLAQATKTRTISTTTSNSGLTTPTAGISNLVPTQIIPTTTTASTNTRTLTPSTSNPGLPNANCPQLTTRTAQLSNCIPKQPKRSRTVIVSPPSKAALTTTTPFQPPVSTIAPTVSSEPALSTTSIQEMPISTTTSILNTKSTTPMEVTITKKTRLSTDASVKKATRFAQRAPLQTQEEVIKCIKLMEEFAMMNENFRLIGFLERLEQQVYVNKTK